jgi:hypothetical protein
MSVLFRVGRQVLASQVQIEGGQGLALFLEDDGLVPGLGLELADVEHRGGQDCFFVEQLELEQQLGRNQELDVLVEQVRGVLARLQHRVVGGVLLACADQPHSEAAGVPALLLHGQVQQGYPQGLLAHPGELDIDDPDLAMLEDANLLGKVVFELELACAQVLVGGEVLLPDLYVDVFLAGGLQGELFVPKAELASALDGPCAVDHPPHNDPHKGVHLPYQVGILLHPAPPDQQLKSSTHPFFHVLKAVQDSDCHLALLVPDLQLVLALELACGHFLAVPFGAVED